MPDTPLNPDALDKAAAAARIAWSGRTDWNGAPNSVQIEYRNLAHAAVVAYLTVAQPEVNSVEELEALPVGSVVRSGGREFYKTSYIEHPWILPYGAYRFGSQYLSKHSRVTLAHRPEASDA